VYALAVDPFQKAYAAVGKKWITDQQAISNLDI
jgi:hypothetical protein